MNSVDHLTLKTVNTVAELMQLQEQFGTLTPPDIRRWAFRGQSREYGNLVPSFKRLFSTQSFSAAELIERKLIEDFRKHYQVLSNQNNSAAVSMLSIGNGHDLKCLSVMQHYEVPTRLLDWTSDFWTAIYFACAGEPDSNAELWFYDRVLFSEQHVAGSKFESLLFQAHDAPREPDVLGLRDAGLLLEFDPRLNSRMQSQFGHHTVSSDVFQDHADLLDDLQKKREATENAPWYFRRLVIDKSCKGKVLQFLADYKNMTAGTIYPDVVGLGRFLRWQLDSLRTMLL
ncbi:MAG TPA: FRG domain-containing protein [Arenimonas sp.]|nr:FRG domain-containing protein [Arenimonas sp.]HOZ04634.1 FRG domain-containing protein [Arenimonas sp.]HPO23380.1 FRG domain-containing protein [Arenimonas sp.]HPW32202.1 FRG domain-containing protein [Arenimonas sp.]